MLPPVVFVLGKGGVGRTTIATALGASFAACGEHVLVMQWALADAISPWFGRSPAGYDACDLEPGLATMNFTAEAALAQYFVEHLHMRTFYRAVVANRHVRQATRAAPGLEELMFLGTVMWLTTLARAERGWSYDRVIVDAPAMGHGASLFAIPHVTGALGLGGLLATECERVSAMLADPARVAALVVTTPEELAIEETLEFWPRVARDLERPPVAAVLNRSVRSLGALPLAPRDCAWLDPAAPSLDRIYAHLARRAERELALRDRLAQIVVVDDALLVATMPEPRAIIGAAAAALEPLWSRA